MEFSEVSFAYRRGKPVVDRLSWTVPPGVTVLLGPNGAGKSTSLSLAASVLKPQSGRIRHRRLLTDRGRDLSEWRHAVGWVPQHIDPIPGFTVVEQVAYAAWLKGVANPEARRRAYDALSITGLTSQAENLVSRISGGQLRRVGIAAALVHDSEVLLLDEPTAGLDPSQRSRLRRYIAEIRSDHDVIISTHQVDDLELVADNIAIMRRGKILFCGPTKQFLVFGRGDQQVDSSKIDPLDDSPNRLAERAYAYFIGTDS